MGGSSEWGRRSATPPRSSTRGDRSGYASCAPSSTSSRGTDTSAVDGPVDADRPVVRPEQPAAPAELRSVGLLGGTFNPPHLGHLSVARHAHDELGPQELVMMHA